MFVLANFLIALSKVVGIVNFFLSIYIYIIIFRALISWVNPDPYNQVVQFLNNSTEPLLAPIRRWLIRVFRREFWIDVSPIVAMLLIYILQILLQYLVANSLVDLAMKIK